jgi:hypothetical protein
MQSESIIKHRGKQRSALPKSIINTEETKKSPAKDIINTEKGIRAMLKSTVTKEEISKETHREYYE